MTPTPHILVVCTGNICRSPVGAAVLKSRLEARGLAAWQVSSAGTLAAEGQPASRYSLEALQEIERIDLSTHRSRLATAERVAHASLILCMAEHHKSALSYKFPQAAVKIHLLAEMSAGEKDVVDPFGQDKLAYKKMVQDVIRLTDQGVPRIIQLAQGG